MQSGSRNPLRREQKEEEKGYTRFQLADLTPPEPELCGRSNVIQPLLSNPLERTRPGVAGASSVQHTETHHAFKIKKEPETARIRSVSRAFRPSRRL